MINTDEDALFCDFAETYHVFDYTALPPFLAARLASGLRDSSRIKQKLSGLNIPLDISLFAAMVDALNILIWQQTKDGANGKNKPKSILNVLLNASDEKKVEGFQTPEEWQAAWKAANEKA